MRTRCKCSSIVITMVFMIILSFLIGCHGGGGDTTTSAGTTPVLFVHGGAGSADQFETQAMRFASNGYRASYISGFEYDTTVSGFDFDMTTLQFTDPVAAAAALAVVDSALDAHIDSVLKQTGAAQVDLLGHSLGTLVCQAYLADPTRAAKVAHYVNIDGQQSHTPPGGVPTLAIFAALSSTSTDRSIGGATNMTLDNTTHVQAASCVESFTAIYKFFNNDKAPATTDILSGSSNNIELAGRVITFETNAVPANLKLVIYEVNKDTGVRIRSTPDYSTSIDTDGNFKFTNATAGSNYEFYLTSTADATSVHYYYEPFTRSDYLIRLKFIATALMPYIVDQSANHSNLIVIRDKEFLGVNTMSPNEDSLKVKGTEVCAGVLPKTGILGTPIALFIFDKGSDGVSDLSGPITSGIVANLSFISGLDFYMRAANPPDSTIPVVLNGRYSGKTQVVNVPNWPSTTDNITVQMWDY
jgi:dienelactone hydrolase